MGPLEQIYSRKFITWKVWWAGFCTINRSFSLKSGNDRKTKVGFPLYKCCGKWKSIEKVPKLKVERVIKYSFDHKENVKGKIQAFACIKKWMPDFFYNGIQKLSRLISWSILFCEVFIYAVAQSNAIMIYEIRNILTSDGFGISRARKIEHWSQKALCKILNQNHGTTYKAVEAP